MTKCPLVQGIVIRPVRKLRISESEISGRLPMDLEMPPLKINKNMFESNPLRSRVLFCEVAVRLIVEVII